LGDSILLVSIREQALLVCTPRGVSHAYAASTGARPPSNVENSHGTPLGWHLVEEKIGDGLPLGEVLIGRVATGKFFWQFPDWRGRGYVTTRILRLRGVEEGVNAGVDALGRCVDSFRRTIYIHGTAYEDRIGTPHSGGCVTLRCQDMVNLFEITPIGSALYIDENDFTFSKFAPMPGLPQFHGRAS
jgi:hypothetical protein